jgi:hypothetical protein
MLAAFHGRLEPHVSRPLHASPDKVRVRRWWWGEIPHKTFFLNPLEPRHFSASAYLKHAVLLCCLG